MSEQKDRVVLVRKLLAAPLQHLGRPFDVTDRHQNARQPLEGERPHPTRSLHLDRTLDQPPGSRRGAQALEIDRQTQQSFARQWMRRDQVLEHRGRLLIVAIALITRRQAEQSRQVVVVVCQRALIQAATARRQIRLLEVAAQAGQGAGCHDVRAAAAAAFGIELRHQLDDLPRVEPEGKKAPLAVDRIQVFVQNQQRDQAFDVLPAQLLGDAQLRRLERFQGALREHAGFQVEQRRARCRAVSLVQSREHLAVALGQTANLTLVRFVAGCGVASAPRDGDRFLPGSAAVAAEPAAQIGPHQGAVAGALLQKDDRHRRTGRTVDRQPQGVDPGSGLRGVESDPRAKRALQPPRAVAPRAVAPRAVAPRAVAPRAVALRAPRGQHSPPWCRLSTARPGPTSAWREVHRP